MAALFTFNSCTIGSTAVTTAEFVYGYGQFIEEGFDAENSTADGVHRYDRITVKGEGKMTLYGNRTSLASPATIPSLSHAIELNSTGTGGGVDIVRTGVVTDALYDDSKQNTVVTFVTDPIPPAS